MSDFKNQFIKKEIEIEEKIFEHEPGCPSICDDESDYEFLYDAGECTCNHRKKE